jgi:hypothetical protein
MFTGGGIRGGLPAAVDSLKFRTADSPRIVGMPATQTAFD